MAALQNGTHLFMVEIKISERFSHGNSQIQKINLREKTGCKKTPPQTTVLKFIHPTPPKSKLAAVFSKVVAQYHILFV